MNKETINLVHKLDDIPKKDFRYILPKELSVSITTFIHTLLLSNKQLGEKIFFLSNNLVGIIILTISFVYSRMREICVLIC